MILAQAGRFGGWSLYLKDGKPAYAYNFLGLEQFTVAAADARRAPARPTIRFEFAYDGGGIGKGGDGQFSSTARRWPKAGSNGRRPGVFSADETADVGMDDATPVTEDYKERDNAFTGKIQKVVVELVKPASK